jgi:hypothetical protein
MIAARSIVLSGGSQQTALSTAKAAAQSILAPHLSESDSVATTGQRFLGRRKGKRQAEIVASMALLSVNNSVQQGKQPSNPSLQWDAGMLVQHPPPAQVVPMQRSMPTFEDCPTNSLLTNSLLAEIPSESYPKEMSDKDSSRLQREKVSRISASREMVGRDPSKDSRRKGRDTRLIESPRSRRRAPSELSRVTNATPIYSLPERKKKERIFVPLSYSTDEGDDDSTAGDVDTTASSIVAFKKNSTGNKGFLQQNVDPLLFSITSAFNCGFSPSETIAAAKDQSQGKRQFGDDNEEDGLSDMEDYDETRDDAEKEVEMDAVILGRTSESEVSMESAQIIRELNVSDSSHEEEEYYARKKEMLRRKDRERKNAGRTSAEEAVLRALSVRGDQKSEPKEPREESRNDRITHSRYDRDEEAFTGVHSNPSRAEKPSLRVITGNPGVEQVFQPIEKPVQSRKTLFQSLIRNRYKGRGATATGRGPTAAETPE